MKIRNEIQIGIVGLVTIAILFFGIKFLKGSDLLSSYKSYYSIYDNVSGMHESSYIYVNGLKVGYIKEIEPMDKINKRFLVEIAVEKDVEIPKDSKLVVFSDGLLGGKALRIDAGTSTQILAKNDTIAGIIEDGLMDALSSKVNPIMSDLSSVVKRIDTLSASLNNTFNAQNQENIRQTLENINKASKKLDHIVLNADDLIAKDKQKLDRIITNIESVTENLVAISENIDKNKIANVIDNVNSSLVALNSVLVKIENGEGNLGLLVNDDKLYRNLNESTQKLNALIEDIKQNPKKYINVKVF